MRYTTLAAGLLACAPLVATAQTDAQRPELHVLTYDSFVADWGPGPAIEAAFEADCGCDLVFTTAGDGAAMLARLMLSGSRARTDVVLGLDTNLTHAATESGLFAPHGLSPQLDLPVAWDDPLFLPFDWGWFAFVYDRTRVDTPPTDFDALAASDLRIVIQDPRASTPGLGLLMWIDTLYGERAGDLWAALAPRIVTVTPGWSEAYGLFLEGEADMVLSYTTSPAYHLIAEGDDTKAAALFTQGHYLQIEVAGILADAAQPDLARQFMEFMTSPAFQSIIPTTNWMYPARIAPEGLPDGFDTLVQPEVSLLLSPAEAASRRAEALETWRNALAR
ncbi:MAG: thiamine ABC transporter substrate binding subunit [Paracoccaceae bacterium]